MEIYKTTNKITGDFYIGLNTTSNKEYYGSGVNISKQLYEFGKDNFKKEILCKVNTDDQRILMAIENLFITKHIEDDKCINISPGMNAHKHGVKIKKIETVRYVEVEKVVHKIKYKGETLGITSRLFARIVLDMRKSGENEKGFPIAIYLNTADEPKDDFRITTPFRVVKADWDNKAKLPHTSHSEYEQLKVFIFEMRKYFEALTKISYTKPMSYLKANALIAKKMQSLL